MNKEYDIYRLMDNYSDNEFNEIQWENVDTDSVSKKVMERIKAKRHIKPAVKVMIIAAAVAALGVVTAASIPQTIIRFFTGAELIKDGRSSLFKTEAEKVTPPYSLEGDGLYFTANNEHINITDKVNNETPYIYSYNKTDEPEYTVYIVVGGELDDLGYAEILTNGGNLYLTAHNESMTISPDTGEEVNPLEVVPLGTGIVGEDTIKLVNKPWYDRAIEELGLEEKSGGIKASVN